MFATRIIKIQYYRSPFGELILGSYDGKLCLCDWRYRKMREQIDARLQRELEAEYQVEPSEVADKAISQLQEYFRGERQSFDLPLLLAGSQFQQKVWRQLQQIDYSKSCSYLKLAQELGDPNTIRAVAAANGANAIAIIIPCHRIVGADGDLVGYAGGLTAKKRLLELEGSLKQLELF